MTVQIEESGRVAILTMSGSSGNAVNPEMCIALRDAIAEAVGRGSKAIVLTGSGKAFSVGGDLSLFSEWSDWPEEERQRFIEEGPQAVSRMLVGCPIPTVAALNGAAAGAGMDLALVFDVRIGSPRTKFVTAYTAVGVTPGDGGAWLLPRFIGFGRALELLATSRPIGAEEALSIGLVSQITTEDALLDRSVEVAEGLIGRPISELRSLMLAGMTQTFDVHLQAASKLIAEVAGRDLHRTRVRELTTRS